MLPDIDHQDQRDRRADDDSQDGENRKHDPGIPPDPAAGVDCAGVARRAHVEIGDQHFKLFQAVGSVSLSSWSASSTVHLFGPEGVESAAR